MGSCGAKKAPAKASELPQQPPKSLGDERMLTSARPYWSAQGPPAQVANPGTKAQMPFLFSDLQQNITGKRSCPQPKSTSNRQREEKVEASRLTVGPGQSAVVEGNGNVQVRITFWRQRQRQEIFKSPPGSSRTHPFWIYPQTQWSVHVCHYLNASFPF